MTSFILLFRYFGTDIIARNRDSGGWDLQIHQSVQAISWEFSKESIDTHLIKDRVDLVCHPE